MSINASASQPSRARSRSPKYAVSFRQSSFTAASPARPPRCRQRGDREVEHADAQPPVLAQPVALEHPRAERRYAPSSPVPTTYRRRRRACDNDAEHEGAGHVDRKRPPRKAAADALRTPRRRAGTGDRADAAEHADPEPTASLPVSLAPHQVGRHEIAANPAATLAARTRGEAEPSARACRAARAAASRTWSARHNPGAEERAPVRRQRQPLLQPRREVAEHERRRRR